MSIEAIINKQQHTQLWFIVCKLVQFLIKKLFEWIKTHSREIEKKHLENKNIDKFYLHNAKIVGTIILWMIVVAMAILIPNLIYSYVFPVKKEHKHEIITKHKICNPLKIVERENRT